MFSSAFLKKIDSLGLAGSFACAIHCAITPLVLSLFLTMGAHKALFEGWEHIDLICLLLAPCLASLSLKEGYCKHQSKIPALLFILGFFFLLFGYFLGKGILLNFKNIEAIWHPLFMTSGGLTVAIAHFVNIKLLSQKSNCPVICNKQVCSVA